MNTKKRSYHPYIPLLYNLGKLENDFICQIPVSTLYEWKSKDFNSLFGADLVTNHFPDFDLMNDFITHKNFAQIIKSVYRIFIIYQTIFNTLKTKRTQLKKHQKIIINTIVQIKDSIGFDKALKAFDLSHQQFYRWKNKVNCTIDNRFLCRRKHPLQLAEKEIKVLKKYLSDPCYTYWPLSSVYWMMQRNMDAFMSLTTFYKYAQLFNFNRIKPDCRNKKHALGIRASKPFEILHADVTVFKPMDNTKVYIYFIVDNYSRNILAWKASLKLSAKITFENLREVYEKYNLKKKHDIIFMTDDGSENKAEVDDYIESINLQRLIAQKDITFSNSIIEAVNRKIKYEFLYCKPISDFTDTERCLEKDIPDYSNRPHSALFGLTPNEVTYGAIPDKERFKHQKQLARAILIMENTNCTNCK